MSKKVKVFKNAEKVLKNVRIAISEILLSTLPSFSSKMHPPPLLRHHLIKICRAF